MAQKKILETFILVETPLTPPICQNAYWAKSFVLSPYYAKSIMQVWSRVSEGWSGGRALWETLQ